LPFVLFVGICKEVVLCEQSLVHVENESMRVRVLLRGGEGELGEKEQMVKMR
jgi:hypothetical protein